MSNGLENLKYLSKKRKKPNEGKLKLFPKKLFLNKYFQKKKKLTSSLVIDLNKASIYTLKSIKLENFYSSCVTNSTSENESVEKKKILQKKR